MNIVQVLLHAIEERDMVELHTSNGYDVFNFNNPTESFGLRPGIPNAPVHQDLLDACERKRQSHAGESPTNAKGDPIHDWAKFDLPDEVIDWMDVLIVHHAEHTFIPANWERVKHKRVIWRTVGQSVKNNEETMAPYRGKGMEIVRYSPKERNIPGFAGEDALIRFGKDPAEWYGWTGEEPVVINITQNLRQRDPYTNWGFWDAATQGLNRLALGPGSEAIGGPGSLTYEEMKGWLRKARCYLYTGTQPASYTLGLIEAMMTGIPVVSIGPEHMNVFPYGPDLFEGHELIEVVPNPRTVHTPGMTRLALTLMLTPELGEVVASISERQRAKAIELFGIDTIRAQWKAYLG